MTPTELWLPIGAIAFYLYDAAQGLWQNEVLFVRAGSRWHIAGESQIRRWGRRLVMPNPLLPHRALFRVAWSPDDRRGVGDPGVDALLRELRPLGVICQALLWLLLALLPVCWILGAGIVVLAQFALYYVLVIAALVYIYSRRARLALSQRAFFLLAFDVLACAPFAVNLVRRLSQQHGLAGDPVAFAAQHFDAPTRVRLATLIRGRVEESAAGAPVVAERRASIARWLARLETGAS